MTFNIDTIPAERLALLDNAVLYHGSHDGGTGGPDCKHCARELLYEVVTGKHQDATPPGYSVMIAILPTFNDGPWLNDEHRTRVMRPYLKKMLALDPVMDAQRVFYLTDHIYRVDLPTICDLFKETKAAATLRALPKIVDNQSALDALGALGALRALGALGALRALGALGALGALRALGALDKKQIAYAWEKNVTDALDLICSI